MKNILVIFALLINSFVFASNHLNSSDIEQVVSYVAKSERKFLWRDGHENVSSNHYELNAASLNKYLERQYEERLDDSDVNKIKSCVKADDCVAYNISIHSEYYSGYGIYSVFVLIDLSNGKYDASIRHSVYSE